MIHLKLKCAQCGKQTLRQHRPIRRTRRFHGLLPEFKGPWVSCGNGRCQASHPLALYSHPEWYISEDKW